MKSIYIKFLCFGMMSIGMMSCNDALDIENTEALSDLAVWNSEQAADMYVTASYKTFTDASQVYNSRPNFYDSFSDHMKSTSWDMYGAGYNKALLQASAFSTGSAGALDVWSPIYAERIRRVNVLLDDIKRYGVEKFGQDWADIRIAEAKLCRAYSYFRLMRVYGGVVIRTDVSGVNGGVDDGANMEDIHRARASEKESWDFIIRDLQWAAEHLPNEWPLAWQGRATKKTAFGLLSRIGLYAQEWEIAAEAAEKAKELGAALVADYAKLFDVDGGQNNSPEVLFELSFLSGSITHEFDRFNRPFGDRAVYNFDVYAEHVPTAELADLYEFKDGSEFDWNTYSSEHDNPFTDREPRFHATILYNGADWEGRTIETFVGGVDGFVEFEQSGSTNGHTPTGYYLRKFLQEGYADFITKGSYQSDPILRYGEVLLNKAEAYAEINYAANRDKALVAINEVRARVDLPAITIVEAPNKEDFMALLRRERAVELAAEGFRYWDLRRWKLAELMINGKNAHGVKIIENNGEFSYERVAVDGGSPRIFLERYYYLSLPTAELSNNNKAINNPFW